MKKLGQRGRQQMLRNKVPFVPVMGENRGMLNRIRQRAVEFGFKASDVRPHRLLLYAKLENDKSNLTWLTNVENGGYDAAIMLEKSDAFYVNDLGLAIHKVPIINGAEAPANSPLIFYPDANWFGLTNEARDLEGLYNSKLSIRTDTDMRLQDFHTSQLRYVPEQQYQPSATDPLTFQYSKDPLYKVNSNWGLWGNKRNELELRYGQGVFAAIAGDATDGTDPHVNYGVIVLDGYVIISGAEAVTRSDAHMLFEGA